MRFKRLIVAGLILISGLFSLVVLESILAVLLCVLAAIAAASVVSFGNDGFVVVSITTLCTLLSFFVFAPGVHPSSVPDFLGYAGGLAGFLIGLCLSRLYLRIPGNHWSLSDDADNQEKRLLPGRHRK